VVELTTSNFNMERYFDYAVDTRLALSNVYLRPGEGVVLRWNASDDAENTLSCRLAATLAAR